MPVNNARTSSPAIYWPGDQVLDTTRRHRFDDDHLPSNTVEKPLPIWLASMIVVTFCSIFWIGCGTILMWVMH